MGFLEGDDDEMQVRRQDVCLQSMPVKGRKIGRTPDVGPALAGPTQKNAVESTLPTGIVLG